MICRYCKTYSESDVRPNNYERFCHIARKIVEHTKDACKYFELSENFWCEKTNCWLSIPMCYARQTKEQLYTECTRCRQKREILETKRFVGRLSQPKRIVIRREA
jgi:hypothetical protein